MTTLRFVGDVPLWLGLLLSLLVGVMSWRYYSRESFDLPRRLKWFLPLLRSLAFFLGIMILTGPVLHHRTIIGELGKVKIYIDSSRSMTMHDRHMSAGRKLMIASQLGWIDETAIDDRLLKLADALSESRLSLSMGLSTNTESGANANSVAADATGVEANRLRLLAGQLASSLKEIQPQPPTDLSERFSTELIAPLEEISKSEGDNVTDIEAALQKCQQSCESFEASVRSMFDADVARLVDAGDQMLRTAISQFDEMPRWRRAELGLAESPTGILAALREKHDVELFSLNGNLASPMATLNEPSNSNPTTPSTGDTSDLEDSFSSVTDLSTGIVGTQKSANAITESSEPDSRAKTAIVLITDGQHNSGPSPLQTARVLGGQGVSFYAVSVGASLHAPDLAVTGIEHPDLVFQKDTVRGVMIIRDQMLAGQPFVAQIRHHGEVLWQQQLVTQNVPERRIEFEFPIDELVTRAGSQLDSDMKQHSIPLELEASIASLPDESETENNIRSIRLAAIVSSYKVLLIDGRSRWETRYLRNVFERDEQWSVNTIVAGPGTDDPALRRGDLAGQFPATRDKLFEYDMIVFGEVPIELFAELDLQWLREFVEVRGGGVVFIDGQRGRIKEVAAKGFGDLLPVEWLTDVITTKPASLQLTDAGAAESAFRLAAEDVQNRRFWTELPPPHSLNAVNAQSGSQILVEAIVEGRPRPAVVTRAFGAGRVVYFAFDETWRWRYKAADTWHQRFWNQLAQYVMPKPFAVSDDFVSIDTGSVRYDHEAKVGIRVRLLGLDGKPAVNSSVDALIWKDGQIVSTVNLTADTDVPGIYRGQSAAMMDGDYEVSVRASGYSDAALKARSKFVVLPPETGEMNNTAANESLLKQMTTSTGGLAIREEDFSQLPDLLGPLSNGRVIESDTMIWQSYWWFAAIVILLTVEWVLRKRAGLL